MPLSKKKRISNEKYQKENCKRYCIIMSKERSYLFEKFCEIKGYTKNGFFINAIFNQIERESGKTIEELKKDFEKIDDPTSIDDLDILEEYTFKDKE